ncbi:DUF4468 domain-containing protein [Flavobacterium sp. XGLA_31]|uniref:DUF4468 domain-containing protein n=1 Tax=Flavobacterium sp. XGLA_31 TaxID=3447666 RepID=UPI003F325DE7
MKLKACLLLVFITTATFAQDTEFKFSKDGLTDFIVTSFDSPAKTLYTNALAWVKENNKAPDAVKMTVENEKITFQGIKDNFFCNKAGGTTVCSKAIYTIEMTFKDGKYKFDITEIVLKDINGKISRPNMNDFSEYYDKDGNLKKYMTDLPATYETYFNGLNKSFVSYMEKKKKAENW